MFSSTRQRFIKWLGFGLKDLPDDWQEAMKTYSKNGAVKV